MNTSWIIAVVAAVLVVKGMLLQGFIKRKMAESEAAAKKTAEESSPTKKSAGEGRPHANLTDD